MEINGFSEHFGQLSDPRQSSKVCYPLFDVLFLTLCAVIAGCEGWEQEPSLPTSPSWLIAISAAAEKRTCRQLSKQKIRCFHPLGFQIVLR